MTGQILQALDVFISYSHRDEALKNELVELHLKPLQRQGKISTWQDRDIEAGTEWAKEIKENLEKAHVILLLVTRSFLASDYCYETEMQRAVQRHHEGTARVIPIILEPCSWKYSPFQTLQVLPRDGKPVTLWAHQAEAFLDVEEGIRKVIDSLNAEHQRREEEAAQQREAEQLRQQQEIERLQRQRQEAERLQQQRQEAERLQREREEAERLEQQRLEAERREQERQQKEAAERQKQTQAEQARRRQQEEAAKQEQERQRQAAEAWEQQRRVERAASRKTQEQPTGPAGGTPGISRRRALQIVGFGGGGLAVALVVNAISTDPSDSEADSASAGPSDSEADSAENPSGSEVSQSEASWPEPPDISSSDPNALSAVEIQTVKVDDRGNITEQTPGQVNAFREDLGNGVDLDMVAIPAGEFVRGSPEDESRRYSNEGPQRTVSVPAFFMGRFTITQAQYGQVMGANPSRFQQDGANRPVEQVSWHDAVAFCEKLSEQTGRTYRLPSEAEWEYACRAGTNTPFYFGPTITADLANYDGN